MSTGDAPPTTDLVHFVERKHPDFEFVEEVLRASADASKWTNFGPVSRRLEAEVATTLQLPDDRSVVACASGTAALDALVGLYGYLSDRPLRWVVSALTFECQRQGRLADSIVVDCAADGFLDLDLVERLDLDHYDGVIVTNLFGGAADVDAWSHFAATTGKRVVFDSAASFGSTHEDVPLGRFGDGEAFSFHHTKPLGVGEGGCVVVPAEQEATVRSLINFGRYGGIDTGRFSMNGKMSDPAAAFVLDRLRSADAIRATHRSQWRRIVDLAMPLGYTVVGDPAPGLPSAVALAAPRPVPTSALADRNPVVHKLYRPLSADAPVAADIHARLVCLPCHGDVASVGDDRITRVLADL